jgi:hypothetical protein
LKVKTVQVLKMMMLSPSRLGDRISISQRLELYGNLDLPTEKI